MQLMIAKSAYDRIKPRLDQIAPNLDIVTVAGGDAFERGGQKIAPEAANPDLVWLSFDTLAAGLVPVFLQRLLQANNPKWMQIMFAGLDNPVFKQVMAKGIRLTKSSAQAPPIAEHVIAHAFALIVPIDSQRDAQAKKEWRRTPFREISQTRWTLVGFGSIGKLIAQRLKPFGAHLTVVRRSPAPDPLADAVIDMSGLPNVLPQSDVVVLANSLNDATKHMANDKFFAAMKEGSILINIARGALIDDAALQRGLAQNKPAHAVLDVFEPEPLPSDSWMWTHPKVRISGHTSNAGSGTPGRGDTLFLENLKRYLADEPLLNEAHKSEVGL
jgi:phosphoglycerate dehydrogenase-like enzyme